VIKLRVNRRWGSVRIAANLDMVASTVHHILTRAVARPRFVAAAVGDVAQFFDVDVARRTKQLRSPRPEPRPEGRWPTQPRLQLHNAVDDHSRLAYTEMPPDETKETAAAFRAPAFYRRRDHRDTSPD
jgi:hypothetical protein